jgi:hypothetical protein
MVTKTEPAITNQYSQDQFVDRASLTFVTTVLRFASYFVTCERDSGLHGVKNDHAFLRNWKKSIFGYLLNRNLSRDQGEILLKRLRR